MVSVLFRSFRGIRILVAAVFFAQTALSQDGPPRGDGGKGGKLPKVDIGSFSIPMNDPDLTRAFEEAKFNMTTLAEMLAYVWGNTLDYWSELPWDETPNNVTAKADLEMISASFMDRHTLDRYFPALYNKANEVAIENFTVDQEIVMSDTGLFLPEPDTMGYFLDAIYNMTDVNWYYQKAALMGVGRRSRCQEHIDTVIASKNEWLKLGSSTATTLMALIPTLLAFGSLYVPRNSEVYATSNLVGLTTGLYTLGLPVRSISALRLSNQHAISGFGAKVLALINNLGTVDKTNGRAKWRGTVENMNNITDDSSDKDPVKAMFGRIRRSIVDEWDQRWHFWHVPNMAVSAGQIVMFVLAIYPLFKELGVPNFIFTCGYEKYEWTALYLAVSASVNAVVRLWMWQNSSHERAKAYALSPKTKDLLDDILARRITKDEKRDETTATDLPPLYPTPIRRLYDLRNKIIYTIFRKQLKHSGHTSSDFEKQRAAERRKGQPRSVLTSIASPFKFIIRYISPRWSYIMGTQTIASNGQINTPNGQKRTKSFNLLDMLGAGFIGTARSARRFRPVYLLIHLSQSGRSPVITLLVGMIEAALLLVLTFFFSAQWGGNLFITAVALSLLILFITLGRAVGLLYVWLSSRVFGLTVVQCDSADEVRGVLRILCSMRDCLIEVNGATYYRGYRMDVFDKDWDDFQYKYHSGALDDEIPPTTKHTDDDDQRFLTVLGCTWKTQRHETNAAQTNQTAQSATRPPLTKSHSSAAPLLGTATATPPAYDNNHVSTTTSIFATVHNPRDEHDMTYTQGSQSTGYQPVIDNDQVEMQQFAANEKGSRGRRV